MVIVRQMREGRESMTDLRAVAERIGEVVLDMTGDVLEAPGAHMAFVVWVESILKEAVNEARAEMREQAAKIAEKEECSIARGEEVCNCDIEIAAKIRALKDKP